MSSVDDDAVLAAMRANAKESGASSSSSSSSRHNEAPDSYEDDFDDSPSSSSSAAHASYPDNLNPRAGNSNPRPQPGNVTEFLKTISIKEDAKRRNVVDDELQSAMSALPPAKIGTMDEVRSAQGGDYKRGAVEYHDYSQHEEDLDASGHLDDVDPYGCYGEDGSESDSDDSEYGSESDSNNVEANMTKEQKLLYHAHHAKFFAAVAAGSKELKASFLDNDKEFLNISYLDQHKWTAFHWAALNGREGVLASLVEYAQTHRAVPRQLVAKRETISGWTALHLACLHGNVPCARLLLRIGANPSQPSSLGERPFDLIPDHMGPGGATSKELRELILDAYTALARPWRYCIAGLFREHDLISTVHVTTKKNQLASIKNKSKWSFAKHVMDALPLPSIVPSAPIIFAPLLQHKFRNSLSSPTITAANSNSNSNNNNNGNNNSSSNHSAYNPSIDDILLCRFMCFIGYECGVKGIKARLVKANSATVANLPPLLSSHLCTTPMEGACNSSLCRNFLKAFEEREKNPDNSKIPFTAGMAVKVFERLTTSKSSTSTGNNNSNNSFGRELLMHCRMLTAMLLGIFFIVPKSEYLKVGPRSGLRRSDLLFFDNSDNEISHESVGKQRKAHYLVIPSFKAKASGYQRLYKHFRQETSTSHNLCIVSVMEEWISATQSIVRNPDAYLFSYPDQPDLTVDDVR